MEKFLLLLSLLSVPSLAFKIIAPQGPAERKLSQLPIASDPAHYQKQIQNTHQLMNRIKNHGSRQIKLRAVSDQFNVFSNKLDDFRENLSRKIEELQMSLERPKVAYSGPGPMMMNPLSNPLVSKNGFVSSIGQDYEKKSGSSVAAPSFQDLQNQFQTMLPSVNQAESLSNPPASTMTSVSPVQPPSTDLSNSFGGRRK